MPNTPKRLFFGQPSTTTQTLYTVPSNTTTLVKSIVLHNVTANDATIHIWFPASGGSANDASKLVEYVVKPKDTVIISDDGIFTVLLAGATIRAQNGTSSAITVSISGMEVT